MLELNSKTQQDFLNREWVQRLLDAGVDMSDAKYQICNSPDGDGDIVIYDSTRGTFEEDFVKDYNCVPTYTVSELLNKLPMRICPIIDGKKYFGFLKLGKDASFNGTHYEYFYKVCYALYSDNSMPLVPSGDYTEGYIWADSGYLIEALASLLIQCHKKDIGLKTKDTDNISDK